MEVPIVLPSASVVTATTVVIVLPSFMPLGAVKVVVVVVWPVDASVTLVTLEGDGLFDGVGVVVAGVVFGGCEESFGDCVGDTSTQDLPLYCAYVPGTPLDGAD